MNKEEKKAKSGEPKVAVSLPDPGKEQKQDRQKGSGRFKTCNRRVMKANGVLWQHAVTTRN